MDPDVVDVEVVEVVEAVDAAVTVVEDATRTTMLPPLMDAMSVALPHTVWTNARRRGSRDWRASWLSKRRPWQQESRRSHVQMRLVGRLNSRPKSLLFPPLPRQA